MISFGSARKFSAGVFLLLAVGSCQRSATPRRANSKTAEPAKTADPEKAAESARTSSNTVNSNKTTTVEKTTHVVVRNVIFHSASPIKLKVKWLRGSMYPTDPIVVPTFDDPASFRFRIDEALIEVSLDDLSQFLKEDTLRDSPLRNARVSAAEGRLRINGTIQRILPLPVQMIGTVGVSPDRRHLRLHADKISILKLPFKRVLHTFHLQLSDLVGVKGKKGVLIEGDNIDIDVNKLLPPPQAAGELTQVKLSTDGNLLEYYGTPQEEAATGTSPRNFMRMRGGTLGFGKLVMHNADLLLVDSSPGDWLNFDLRHYQEQLVNGNTHITPQAGLQIFIPDFKRLTPQQRGRNVSVEWMRNRSLDPPDEAP